MEGLTSKKRALNTRRNESRVDVLKRNIMTFASELYNESKKYNYTNEHHESLFIRHIVFNDSDDFFDILDIGEDYVLEMPFQFAKVRPQAGQPPLIFISPEANKESTLMVVVAHDYAHFHLYWQ